MVNTEMAVMTGALCRGGCGDPASRPLERAPRLCVRCERRLSADLSRLVSLYEECGRQLGGAARGTTVSRTSGGFSPGIAFNTAVADARSAIVALLSTWSALVADQRRVAAPPREAGSMARFLRRHLAWLSAHDAAGDLCAEVSAAVRRAHGAVHPLPLRRVRVGACVQDHCPGELTALVRAPEADLPPEIVCSGDAAHRWPTHEWVRLSRRLAGGADAQGGASRQRAASGQGAAGGWLSAYDITRLWGVPTGSVYRLASEKRWRRGRSGGRLYYHATDVERTFGRRLPR